MKRHQYFLLFIHIFFFFFVNLVIVNWHYYLSEIWYISNKQCDWFFFFVCVGGATSFFVCWEYEIFFSFYPYPIIFYIHNITIMTYSNDSFISFKHLWTNKTRFMQKCVSFSNLLLIFDSISSKTNQSILISIPQ